MAFLGAFKEAINQIRFRLIASKPLQPASVQLILQPASELPIPIPMVESPDTDGIPHNEFVSAAPFDTTGHNLGTGTVRLSVLGADGVPGSRLDNLSVISSYGRHYGLDYGRGL
jgi:hypothetical protein